MTGEPVYTDSFASEWQRLRGLAMAAITAARSRVKFAKLVAAQLLVGAATGHQIIINPDGETVPAIHLVPASAGGNYTRLWSDDTVYPGEATFRITSGTNAGSTAKSLYQMSAGLILQQIMDESLSSDNGGQMVLAEGFAKYGYTGGGVDQYFWFDATGRTRHVGKWWDFASLPGESGIMAGSTSIGSGNSGATISYGSTMHSTMGPVAVVRDGAANPNHYWIITASSTTSFTMSWSNTTSHAIYWWAHRH